MLALSQKTVSKLTFIRSLEPCILISTAPHVKYCPVFHSDKVGKPSYSLKDKHTYIFLDHLYVFGPVYNGINTRVLISFRTINTVINICLYRFVLSPYNWELMANQRLQLHVIFAVNDVITWLKLCRRVFSMCMCSHGVFKCSKAWAYIAKLSNTNVRCNVGSVLGNKGSNTSNIRKHLHTKHAIYLKQHAVHFISRLHLKLQLPCLSRADNIHLKIHIKLV